MKRRLTRAIKTKGLEHEVELLRSELKLVKERQVEEIAKLINEKAIKDAAAYRQGLNNAIVKFAKIANTITCCPPGGVFNHQNIVLEAQSGAAEAAKLLETKG